MAPDRTGANDRVSWLILPGAAFVAATDAKLGALRSQQRVPIR